MIFHTMKLCVFSQSHQMKFKEVLFLTMAALSPIPVEQSPKNSPQIPQATKHIREHVFRIASNLCPDNASLKAMYANGRKSEWQRFSNEYAKISIRDEPIVMLILRYTCDDEQREICFSLASSTQEILLEDRTSPSGDALQGHEVVELSFFLERERVSLSVQQIFLSKPGVVLSVKKGIKQKIQEGDCHST